MAWEGFGEGLRDLDAQLMGLGPGPAEEEPGVFEKYIRRPVFSVLGKTQNLATEPLFGETEAYKSAAAEMEKLTGREPGAWEALPGMGDVAVQTFSPEFRQSTLGGRVVEPLTRLAGNVLGDPTTYVGSGLLKAAGKVAGKAVQAGRGVRLAELGRAAEALPIRVGEMVPGALGPTAEQVVRGMTPGITGTPLEVLEQGLKSWSPLERYRAARELVAASGDQAAIRAHDFLSKAGVGVDLGIMGAALVAGTPDIVVGTGEALKQTWNALEEGEYGKAGASGTTALVMGGLGYMMGKGAIDGITAAKVLQRSVAETRPQLAAKLAQEAETAAAAEQMGLARIPPPETGFTRGPGEGFIREAQPVGEIPPRQLQEPPIDAEFNWEEWFGGPPEGQGGPPLLPGGGRRMIGPGQGLLESGPWQLGPSSLEELARMPLRDPDLQAGLPEYLSEVGRFRKGAGGDVTSPANLPTPLQVRPPSVRPRIHTPPEVVEPPRVVEAPTQPSLQEVVEPAKSALVEPVRTAPEVPLRVEPPPPAPLPETPGVAAEKLLNYLKTLPKKEPTLPAPEPPKAPVPTPVAETPPVVPTPARNRPAGKTGLTGEEIAARLEKGTPDRDTNAERLGALRDRLGRELERKDISEENFPDRIEKVPQEDGSVKEVDVGAQERAFAHRSWKAWQKDNPFRRVASARPELGKIPKITRMEEAQAERLAEVQAEPVAEKPKTRKERLGQAFLEGEEKKPHARTVEAFTEDPLTPRQQEAMGRYFEEAVSASGMPKVARGKVLDTEALKGLIQDNFVTMGKSKAWRAILDDPSPQAMDHAVRALQVGLNNRIKEYYQRWSESSGDVGRGQGSATRRSLMKYIAEDVDEADAEAGVRPQGVPEPEQGELHPLARTIGEIKRLAPSKEHAAGIESLELDKNLKEAHSFAKEVAQKLHPHGGPYGGMFAYLKKLPKTEIQGTRLEGKNKGKPILVASGDRHINRLVFMNDIIGKYGDVQFRDFQDELAAAEPHIGKFSGTTFSELKKIIRQIVETHDVFRRGVPGGEKVELEGGLRQGAEGLFGVKGSDNLTVGMAPGGADRTPSRKVGVIGESGKKALKGVESGTGRVTHKNGVWIDFKRADGKVGRPITSMHLANVGGLGERGHAPLAEALGELLSNNTELRDILVPVRRTETGRIVSLSENVDDALTALQKAGKIEKRTRPIAATWGEPLPPPILEKGGRPTALRGATTETRPGRPAREVEVGGERIFVPSTVPPDERVHVDKIYKLWDEIRNRKEVFGDDPKYKGELAKLEKEASDLYAEYAKRRGPEAEALRAEWTYDRDTQLAKRWVEEATAGKPQKKLLDRVYNVAGREPERKPKEALREVAHLNDEDVPPNMARLRLAHDHDMLDTPHVEDGVTFVNIDEFHDAETQSKYAKAHKPMYETLSRVVGEVSKAIGLENTFGGVISSPYRHGLLVGGKELGKGKVYLSPQGALFLAGGDRKLAAQIMVDNQLLHELAHAYDNSIFHGPNHEDRMSQLVLRLSKVGDDKRAAWIEELSKEELWKGLEGVHDDYSQRSTSAFWETMTRQFEEEEARLAEQRRASGEGVARGQRGVRPGTSKGRLDALSDRLFKGENGPEARGELGVQRGEAVPEGVRGAEGGVGGAEAVRGGGEQGGEGGTARRVAGGGEGSRRRVASYHPFGERKPTLEESRRAIDELASKEGSASELEQDAFLLAHQMKEALKANLSDPAVKKEWDRRASAKPTGHGELHSMLNELRQVASDDVKVHEQLMTEAVMSHPKLKARWLKKGQTFDDVSDEGRALLEIHSPEDMIKKFEKGLKMTPADNHALRIIALDTMNNYHNSWERYQKALMEWDQMAAGPAKDTFFKDKVGAAHEGWANASSKVSNVRASVLSGREAGRTLAYRRIDVMPTDPISQHVNNTREGLRELLGKRYPKKDELEKVLDTLMTSFEKKLREPDWSTEGQFAFYHEVQKAFEFGAVDKFLQMYKAGLLGWPSRVANIGSNVIHVNVIRKLEKDLSAALGQLGAKIKGETPQSFASEILLTRMIARRGLKEGLGAWRQAQMDALRLKPLDYSLKGVDFNDELVKMPSAISGKKGEFISYTFKGMNADDALFKHQVKVDHYYRQTYRNIKNKVEGFEMRPGETELQATERLVGELSQNIHDMYDKGLKMDKRFVGIHDAAKKLAQVDTYQEAMAGWGKSIQQGMYSGWGKAFQIPIPFVKTPYNIAKQVMKRIPGLGFIPDAVKWGKLSTAEQADAVSRQLVATSLAAGLYAMVGDTEISGSGPIDPEANMLKQQTGWKPYSIKLGDQWISYQRLEPFSSLLGMMADMQEGEQQGDFDRAETAGVKILGSIAENLTNKTFLSGLQNISEALSDPKRYAAQWAKRTEASLVPNSIGFVPYGHLAQAIDPVYREVGINPVEVFKSKTPGLSQTLEPQYTPAGEVRKRPDVLGVRGISPITRSTERTDPVAKAAGMMAEINFPMRRIRNTMDYKGIKVQLEPGEQQRLVKAQNEAMQFIGKRLINDPSFRRLPDNEDLADYPGQKTKKDVIARIIRRYRNPVTNALMPVLRQRASKYLREGAGERRAALGT